MMTIIIKYFITYSILITDKANLIHLIYRTIFFSKSPNFHLMMFIAACFTDVGADLTAIFS